MTETEKLAEVVADQVARLGPADLTVIHERLRHTHPRHDPLTVGAAAFLAVADGALKVKPGGVLVAPGRSKVAVNGRPEPPAASAVA